jgi:hypothetical protein
MFRFFNSIQYFQFLFKRFFVIEYSNFENFNSYILLSFGKKIKINYTIEMTLVILKIFIFNINMTTLPRHFFKFLNDRQQCNNGLVKDRKFYLVQKNLFKPIEIKNQLKKGRCRT